MIIGRRIVLRAAYNWCTTAARDGPRLHARSMPADRLRDSISPQPDPAGLVLLTVAGEQAVPDPVGEVSGPEILAITAAEAV
ncbi:hypothetical protein Cme02nite_48580 [Catellatospora methionotrophica]|uniref:Uncharacterized protein n=2 Tax=Catellatospora methionotrophica TaxID=121620 RepID=A0A8J3PIL5_9ACTN|nr:hypothetical protein Cme02nite_48580 [Catellatospora methionotrophica]